MLSFQNHLQEMTKTDKDHVCYGDKHFKPGHSIFTEITQCLETSAVVVAVMSRNFCKSFYCKIELEQARLMDKPVIMIFIEDVNEADMSDVMREVFRNFTRVKVVCEDGQYKAQPDWPSVCAAIIQLM